MNIQPIIFRGGFRYTKANLPSGGDVWKRRNRDATWTPETSGKIAARIIYYARTKQHLR